MSIDLRRSERENHGVQAKHGQGADLAKVRRWARKVGAAVEHAASHDPRSGWKPEWPMVSAAAEDAVWGLAATNPKTCDVLTEAVRAGGFTI